MDTLEQWLVLNHAPRITAIRSLKLIQHFETIDNIFLASDKDLIESGLKTETIRFIRNPDQSLLQRDLTYLKGSQSNIIVWTDDRYPYLLKQIADPPLLLYVNGNPEVLKNRQLAIVGTRRPTPSGRKISHDFAKALASRGLTITSGLAIGVDSMAHQGALAAKAPTIAVLGNGVDNIYPLRNQKLAEEITAYGAIVSEFPPSTPPLSHHFPKRNRLISGLSIGTLVVEAAQKSGSLITAMLALDQGRDVFAVPGSILNPVSKGCNSLIKEGARLVESVEDIVSEMNLFSTESMSFENDENAIADVKEHKNFTEKQLSILNFIDYEPISIDQLVARSGLTAEELSSMLLEIELAGHVQTDLGGRYYRIT